METSNTNYRVVIEFGNGKNKTIRVKKLEGLTQKCLDDAEYNNTKFMYAKIYPDSDLGKMVIRKGCYVLDDGGLHHYLDKKLIKL